MCSKKNVVFKRIGKDYFLALYRLYAKFVLQQAELQTLKARRWFKVVAEVHEVLRRHRLQDDELVDQQLKAALFTS